MLDTSIDGLWSKLVGDGREFNNVSSLRGAYLYATWQTQQNKIIGRDPYVGFSILLRMTILKIRRSLEFFAVQKIGMTILKCLLTQSYSTYYFL